MIHYFLGLNTTYNTARYCLPSFGPWPLQLLHSFPLSLAQIRAYLLLSTTLSRSLPYLSLPHLGSSCHESLYPCLALLWKNAQILGEMLSQTMYELEIEGLKETFGKIVKVPLVKYNSMGGLGDLERKRRSLKTNYFYQFLQTLTLTPKQRVKICETKIDGTKRRNKHPPTY